MSITNLERKIRFSNLLLEDYLSDINDYKRELISLLEGDNNFTTILESKESYIKPKNQLEADARKLSNDNDPLIAKFGKSVLTFLAKGVKGFDELCICISELLMVGGIVLDTCITVLIGIILYAITIIPFAIILKGLIGIDKAIGKYLNKSSDKNVKKYNNLSKNIQKQTDGIKDIRDLEKIVNINESVQDILDYPDMLPIGEARNLVNAIKALESRRESFDNMDDAIIAMELDLFDNLAPDHLTYKHHPDAPLLESVEFKNDDLDTFMMLENVVSKPLLSTEGLLHGMIAITTEACDKKSILQFLKCYENTVKYEMVNESYKDLPIVTASDSTISYIRNRCSDLPEVMESCDQMVGLLTDIVESCREDVTEEVGGFNPDPCSLASLTPFPVANRRVTEVLVDILKAESDEEITEAMLSFGRLDLALNECYYVSESDGITSIIEADAGKTARQVETKVNQKFASHATKDESKGVKAAVKNTISPMEKFIQTQYKKLKEKDANERREIIMKGGAAPKVLRWIKRGIKLIIGGAIGTYISPVAIITGIQFIGYIASDKYLDKKERAKIMKELDDEIMICNEKIDDSRGDDDKSKKYELMRIRNNLERQRDKIKYNLSN